MFCSGRFFAGPGIKLQGRNCSGFSFREKNVKSPNEAKETLMRGSCGTSMHSKEVTMAREGDLVSAVLLTLLVERGCGRRRAAYHC